MIVSNTPADNATCAPLAADLVANFSEPVSAATGNIELWQVGGGSPLETFNVTNPEHAASLAAMRKLLKKSPAGSVSSKPETDQK